MSRPSAMNFPVRGPGRNAPSARPLSRHWLSIELTSVASAPIYSSLTASEHARPVAAVDQALHSPAERGLRTALPYPACHAKRFPRLAVCACVAGASGRRRGPYSLIKGIKSGKPTPMRPAGRFHHQKGRPHGSTRNTP